MLFRFVPKGAKELMTLWRAVDIIVKTVKGGTDVTVGVCVGIDEVQRLISLRRHPTTGKDGAAAAISGVLKPLVISGHAGAVVCAAVAGLAVQAERYLLYGFNDPDESGEQASLVPLPLLRSMDGFEQMLGSGPRFTPRAVLASHIRRIRQYPRLLELYIRSLLGHPKGADGMLPASDAPYLEAWKAVTTSYVDRRFTQEHDPKLKDVFRCCCCIRSQPTHCCTFR
jgi:hypothetical protein